jgi:hypothetical protein
MVSVTAIVVLHVIVWDVDAGRLLAELTREMPDTAIQTCHQTGVELARRLSREWKESGYPNVSTNVDCHWQRGPLSEPA